MMGQVVNSGSFFDFIPPCPVSAEQRFGRGGAEFQALMTVDHGPSELFDLSADAPVQLFCGGVNRYNGRGRPSRRGGRFSRPYPIAFVGKNTVISASKKL
jgi:hypothetical protein